MNARVATAVTGAITLALGVVGLLYPALVLGFFGLLVQNASDSAGALCEIRATYGGIFIVLGVYTLAATIDPAAHRARLLMLALVWFGACLGRLFGVSLDGNPGLFGWLSAALEVAMGGTLLIASLTASNAADAMPATVGATPPPAGISPPA